MRLVHWIYALGVIAAALCGFFSPWWFLGFAPLAPGLIWAAYDLVEVESDDTARTPERRN